MSRRLPSTDGWVERKPSKTDPNFAACDKHAKCLSTPTHMQPHVQMITHAVSPYEFWKTDRVATQVVSRGHRTRSCLFDVDGDGEQKIKNADNYFLTESFKSKHGFVHVFRRAYSLLVKSNVEMLGQIVRPCVRSCMGREARDWERRL